MITKFTILNKLLDLFIKKSKKGETNQEIQKIKLRYFRITLATVLIISLIMSVVTTLFPNLEFSKHWFYFLDKILNYMLQE